ncbi:MAG: pantoate--beta-alanine ligase [Cycloclasticus sp. symbiont of Poecilosclerida sp. M]|nr:MAG: pantoate--beta-alanine ligase [Cycloclasticus sp. symbiont of Poecilosclerida sp. M]
MIIASSIEDLKQALNELRKQQKTIALVPTMGNLHVGHLKLVDTAKKHADCVVVSLFVNPTQFGANEDLDNYPRTLQNDIDKLQALDADILFTPTEEDMYPLGGSNATHVHVPPHLTNILCGASRSNHFDGVTTIVAKLFNIVQANVAVFGEKDFQQLTVIRQMVDDLNIPIEIIGESIVRETNGLAMSSRNGNLTIEQRKLAPLLQQSLLETKQAIQQGATNFENLEQRTREQLNAHGFKTDYISIINSNDLQSAQAGDTSLIILAAAFLGDVRLIDNLMFIVK